MAHSVSLLFALRPDDGLSPAGLHHLYEFLRIPVQALEGVEDPVRVFGAQIVFPDNHNPGESGHVLLVRPRDEGRGVVQVLQRVSRMNRL